MARACVGEIAAAVRLNAKVVRVEVPWSAFEPSDARIDATALAGMDRLMADATAAGIRVIAIVDSTPCWASSAPASVLRRCNARRAGRANAWPPRHAAEYASFVAFLAQRYGTRLAAIEVWNEPDQINQLYFAGPHKAARYATILKAAYRAIKQANPQVPVLAGSIVGSNGIFLRALYAAGIKGYYDGLAVHYYTLVLAAVREIHEVQLQNGDATPLWLDEFGWSSCYPQAPDRAGTGLRHAGDPGAEPRRRPSLARPRAVRRGRPSSTTSRTTAPNSSACSPLGGTQAAFAALCHGARRARSASTTARSRSRCARRVARRSRADRRPSATSCSWKPSREASCATGRCSRSIASTATRSRCRRSWARAA